ncbi:hypothetical protein I4U23_003744 [Adineta vaga]|nr:hypothetical protein I4U23_003744 [Adineta vaga]
MQLNFLTHIHRLSAFKCALLCHQNPRCRTFVHDVSICQLYQGSSATVSIVASTSTSRVSCDYCYPDRYLVCRNNTCQCPTGTFYDNQDSCLNQLYVDSTMACQDDTWCNQALNLTCQCGKCQCPTGTMWKNKTCVPQYLSGVSCNTSDQCRNDLNLVCSRKNKTCIPMTVVRMPVMTGTLPAKFSYVDMSFNTSGIEWWRAFDNDIYTYWNRLGSYNVLDYIFITFNDTYLLNSIQLTVYGDGDHDPQTLAMYMDENGTCLAQSFWFPRSNSSFYTYPLYYFNTSYKPLATNHLLMSIERWSTFQAWFLELTFFGGLY